MRLGRARDEAEQALADSRDGLKEATGRLEDAVKERRKGVETSEKQLSRAQEEYRKRVAKAEQAVTEAGQARKVGGGFFGPVKVFDDRVTVNGKTFTLTPEVQATVDTAGNLSSTRRHTVTRFALLGPLSLFTPKKTKHDDRELFLLVEGPDWAELVKCDVKQQSATRQLAQSINVAARQVEQTLADRRQRVAAAQQALASSRADKTAIGEAERELQTAHAATETIVERRDELLALAGGYHDQEAKEARKAQALVAEVQSLLAEPLELPALPAELEPGSAAAELEAASEPPEPAAPEAAAAEPEAAEPELDAAADGDAIEQIRRLGELRDGGLITAEEFEAKKAELLRRL